MKTILVPTDFSATAKNAALYAFKLAVALKAKKIIFYNAYQAPPVVTEAAVPVIPVMDINTLKDISASGMKNFMNSISGSVPEGIEVEQQSEFGIISDEINEICQRCGADLIVMGITGTSKLEEVLIGSTATSVVNHTDIPVLIVPDNVASGGVKNILFASDFVKVTETTPVEKIKAILDATGAQLHVVNVYENEKEIDGHKNYEQEILKGLMQQYQPQFHYVQDKNFVHGINSFVDEHNIDMIITVPKKHGFLEGLFKESHTKKLAFHTHVPLMVMKAENDK